MRKCFWLPFGHRVYIGHYWFMPHDYCFIFADMGKHSVRLAISIGKAKKQKYIWDTCEEEHRCVWQDNKKEIK